MGHNKNSVAGGTYFLIPTWGSTLVPVEHGGDPYHHIFFRFPWHRAVPEQGARHAR